MNVFGKSSVEKMAEEHDYEGLYRCLTNSDRMLQLQAAQVLADLNDGAGWRFLLETVRDNTNLESRTIAAEMLGELGHPRAIPILSDALFKGRIDPKANDFLTAVENALEAIGGPQAEEALRRAGYEPVLPLQSHTLIEYDTRFVRPVIPRDSEVSFLSAEQHLNNAVELREAEMTERGLVENGLALMLKPDWSYAWYVRGVLFEDLERIFEAELAYRRAIEFDAHMDEAHEALEELALTDKVLELDEPAVLKTSMTGRDWQQRRNAAAAAGEMAMRGDPDAAELVEPLLALLKDEEREVRHAAVEALGRLDDRRAVLPLLEMEESAWLARFAILNTLSTLGSVDGLVTVLRREMNQIQQRNPVFSSNKDPLLEVEYSAMFEIGVRALERTGDIEALLALAEENIWEDMEDEAGETEPMGGESYVRLEDGEFVTMDDEDEEDEAEEDLTSYVDEVAEMTVIALERLALPAIPRLNEDLLRRLATVPDLTLIDVSDDQAQPVIVKDLSALRQAAGQALQ